MVRCSTRLRLVRPDVGEAYPSVPHASSSGFEGTVDLSAVDGVHRVARPYCVNSSKEVARGTTSQRRSVLTCTFSALATRIKGPSAVASASDFPVAARRMQSASETGARVRW